MNNERVAKLVDATGSCGRLGSHPEASYFEVAPAIAGSTPAPLPSPNPSGRPTTEASGGSSATAAMPRLAAEASGPVGLGPMNPCNTRWGGRCRPNDN